MTGMETLREYVLVLDSLPTDPQKVKAGFNSPQVVTACRCVNVGLFISGNLRRDVTVDIAVHRDGTFQIIQFPGEQLRRVSPDERSISFFLLKAMRKIEDMVVGERRSLDNGITLRYLSSEDAMRLWSNKVLNIADPNAPTVREYDTTDLTGVFLYDKDEVIREYPVAQAAKIYKSRTPERFFHEINLAVDQFMSLRKPS